ncbi:phosphoenolpyruvate synthase [Patescibacteria group bacterium]|nr:phosphoenolpyruvate synthase [Patescibacteria group bacterium]
MDKEQFIIWFADLAIRDVPLVGGKNAALGEMYSSLTKLGVRVPNGFAVTAKAYWHFLEETGLKKGIREALEGVDTHNIRDLQKRGAAVRKLILSVELPEDLKEDIRKAYEKLGVSKGVAVRSSATAEDLPTASFAGQQETYLNVKGTEDVLLSVRKAIASLFTNRAISYREDKGFSHFDVALSVGVQEMVRSDLASSGVLFTVDTETGFENVILLNSSYGLGEMVVQGRVTPDEFVVFKPTLREGFHAVLEKTLGEKALKMVYGKKGTKTVRVPSRERKKFSLTDEEVLQLAKWAVYIEEHFFKIRGKMRAMDIEWAKDGRTGELFVVQARPETVHATKEKNVFQEFRMKEKGETLLEGIAVGTKIAQGKVRVIRSAKNISLFRKGEVLVTESTDPDWEPIMKIAQAIVTDKGGRTSHAAIVSRELGISSIVGTDKGTKVLKTGQLVTVDCSSGKTGFVYKGAVPFEVQEHRIDVLPELRTHLMVNIGSPDEAFAKAHLPVKGVGLGRIEFIIASSVGIHPQALLEYPRLKKERGAARLAREIERRTAGYEDKAQFYVDTLISGIAKIGAAFWPHPVVVRFSDFKTNEYRQLLGGKRYEPQEENPMLGWRGASRYYDEKFREAFALECEAMRGVREERGLKNVIPMVPFCRTPEEGRKVLAIMAEHGLSKEKDAEFRCYVMCEIPSNVERVEEFLELFDGMSIGSNDLTQLALGIDRDSARVAGIGNETDATVKNMLARVIRSCREKGKYSGICGQAPSDYPEMNDFLVEQGIESISLNPDSVLPAIKRIAAAEATHRPK